MDAFNNKKTKLFCIIAGALMVGLLVFQFLPFWTVKEKIYSMNEYIWFPDHNGAVTAAFKTIMGDLGFPKDDNFINWLVLWPVMQTVFAILGLAIHVKAKGNGFMLLFPIACGVSGILGFTRHPILQMGSTWVIQLVISIVMIVVAIVGLVLMVKDFLAHQRELEEKLAEARALEGK